jgi:hypothetical protein
MRHISHPYTSHCSAGYNRPLATGTVAGKPLGLDLTAARSLRSLPFCAAASLAAALCFIFSSFSACIYLTAGSAAPHVAMAGAFRAALGLRFSCAASPSRSRCGCAALALPSCGSCGSLCGSNGRPGGHGGWPSGAPSGQQSRRVLRQGVCKERTNTGRRDNWQDMNRASRAWVSVSDDGGDWVV